MDNAIPSMDKRVFHGSAQVLVGALYPFHGEISTSNMGRSMDGGLQFMETNKKSSNGDH